MKITPAEKDAHLCASWGSVEDAAAGLEVEPQNVWVTEGRAGGASVSGRAF